MYTDISSKIDEDEDFVKESLEAVIKLYLCADMIIGSGSLASSMNCHFASREKVTEFDQKFDAFFKALWEYEFSSSGHNCKMVITFPDGKGYDVNTGNAGNIQVTNFHELMSVLRDDFSWTISSLTGTPMSETGHTWGLYEFSPADYIAGDVVAPCDLAKFFAYQIVCAHFFSNDHVDYIYSAELYRQNYNSLLSAILGIIGLSLDDSTFSWNGVDYLYDSLSSYNFSTVLEGIVSYDVFDESHAFMMVILKFLICFV